ncbi:cytochrome c oxidase assembly protein COX18, mitochondrial isoform X1 [Syngnathus acus]|uniref:cytochrome c oxidase assembly protein COX18, mitochondrial isoform X1 n=1 Tax=Syngnathus acus TaxID=161584 RepID=UPI001885B6ED|nr:cytochrome c oxidase assembly protein COX18, mitochondrial isoform X1 [Syngnathus acus]XP_037116672.1 cytochrome c oxidase assembly protein COX18, mitochondrial isoform X1 [Syngnathus acus]
MLTLGSLHILRLPVRAWCGCALARKPPLPAPPPAYCSSTLRHVSSGGADPGWYEQAALSAPVRLAEDFLIQVQQTSGLPWWLSIAFSTLTIRTLVTLPLAAYQMRVLAKVEALQTEIATLAERLRYQVSLRASERGWTDKQSRFQFRKNLRRLVSQLYVRDNCHPFKASLLVWVQLPLWIGLSLALRNLCAPHSLLHASLATGGTLWFPDLTSPDSTWLLPLALGLTNLFIVELFSLQRSNVSSVHKAVTNALRMLSLLMIPIAAGVPSASFSIPPGDGALLVVLQLGGLQSQSSASRSRSSPDPQTSHAAFRHALQRPDGRRRQEVPQVNGKLLAAVREVAPKPTAGSGSN